MRVSWEWLGSYVDLSGVTPEAIADQLNSAGLEVESIESLGAKFRGVVVGQIQAIEKHPNADKLSLVTVNLGSKTQQVVCGAQNLVQGDLIALAQVGAQVINRKDGSLFTLTPAAIRGVTSEGMICAIEELGLEDQYPQPAQPGIWPINAYARASDLGQPLEIVLGLSADVVLEVAPTANRGDWMSMIGIAREVAALLNRPLTLPSVPPIDLSAQSSLCQIKLEDPSVCGYYGGVQFDTITIGPAPDWMVKRLQAAGVRSINNVVDITNYVMLEWGQPLHAFDAACLGAGVLGVRRAAEGETLTTLDDVARPLTPEAVCITHNNQPVAMAGVMGGQSTEITPESKTLFLEGAWFPAATTRRSARSVGLRSDAAARYERGVDHATTRQCLLYATQLLQQFAQAQPVALVEDGTLTDDSNQPHAITFRLNQIARLLGVSVPTDQVIATLDHLGFGVTTDSPPDTLQVTVPSWRVGEVTREADLVEEVIRIVGYDHVPATLPAKSAAPESSFRAKTVSQLHQVMRASGLTEVVSNSLIGESLLAKTQIPLDEATAARVLNSHSDEHTVLRQSLLPTLLEVAKFNQSNGVDAVWVYELGRVYAKRGKAQPKQSGVVEKLMLSGLLLGSAQSGHWHSKPTLDFYALKGVIENLLARLQLCDGSQFIAKTDVAYLHPGKTAELSVWHPQQKKPVSLGQLGQLHPAIQGALKFREPVFVFELDIETLLKICKSHHDAQLAAPVQPVTVSPYPAVTRDMALCLETGIAHQQVIETIGKLNDPLVRDVVLFDHYQGPGVPEGHRSLAYRVTFQSPDATLTDADVDTRFSQIKSQLEQNLSAQFR